MTPEQLATLNEEVQRIDRQVAGDVDVDVRDTVADVHISYVLEE